MLFEPRVCVESVRDCVAVSTWTTVITCWDKHADIMNIRKTCARMVCCLQLLLRNLLLVTLKQWFYCLRCLAFGTLKVDGLLAILGVEISFREEFSTLKYWM